MIDEDPQAHGNLILGLDSTVEEQETFDRALARVKETVFGPLLHKTSKRLADLNLHPRILVNAPLTDLCGREHTEIDHAKKSLAGIEFNAKPPKDMSGPRLNAPVQVVFIAPWATNCLTIYHSNHLGGRPFYVKHWAFSTEDLHSANAETEISTAFSAAVDKMIECQISSPPDQ